MGTRSCVLLLSLLLGHLYRLSLFLIMVQRGPAVESEKRPRARGGRVSSLALLHLPPKEEVEVVVVAAEMTRLAKPFGFPS